MNVMSLHLVGTGRLSRVTLFVRTSGNTVEEELDELSDLAE